MEDGFSGALGECQPYIDGSPCLDKHMQRQCQVDRCYCTSSVAATQYETWDRQCGEEDSHLPLVSLYRVLAGTFPTVLNGLQDRDGNSASQSDRDISIKTDDKYYANEG